MSDRLRKVFQGHRPGGRPLFGPYVTGGYPRAQDTVPILLAAEAGGADIIELGVPFSDPLADGATIQHANDVSLAHGTTFLDCCAFVRAAREQGLKAPVLFMGYYNPLLAIGDEEAARAVAEAGGDGFIVVDLPPEESTGFAAACRRYGLSIVPLVAPTTPDERIEKIAAMADTFIYCVSVTGITGQRDHLPPDLSEFISRVRKHTSLPLAVGFGLSTRTQVAAVGEFADAAMIGSAIIATIDAAGEDDRAQRVREFVEDVSGH